MKYAAISTPFLICVLLLFSCTSKTSTDETASADVPADSLQSSEAALEDMPRNDILYHGAADDSARAAMETFPPLTHLENLFEKMSQVKDSLMYAHEGNTEASSQDSIVVEPFVAEAYQAILDYQQMLTKGTPGIRRYPGLLKLTRETEAGDSTLGMLPEVKPSNLLARGDFFFLGGAPFNAFKSGNVDSVFTGPDGKPEKRYISGIVENTGYLLNAMFYYKKASAHVTFGGPLNSYEGSPRQVRGIGSIVHEFDRRIPAFFLTEQGIVPAQLVSILVKLADEYGCIPSGPQVEFACATPLRENDILGIYIPYSTMTLTSCAVTRNKNVWTADLNADGIPDLGCVAGIFSGASSDTMAEALWFVNVNGSWKIIDFGQEVDCT